MIRAEFTLKEFSMGRDPLVGNSDFKWNIPKSKVHVEHIMHGFVQKNLYSNASVLKIMDFFIYFIVSQQIWSGLREYNKMKNGNKHQIQGTETNI